jgi:hypothetical protein
MKYGFVYIWYDRKWKRYYIGAHWGTEDDGYICSSPWMKQAYNHRPYDFKRRILKTNISSKLELYEEELYWLLMIKPEETKPVSDMPRYYNLHINNNENWHKYDSRVKTVGEKISISKKGKLIGPQPQKGPAISKAKKGKSLTEEHKASLRKPKSTGSHSDERKALISEKSKEFWDSPEGIALKEKRRTERRTEESNLKTSQTLKEKGHKPTKECKEASIKKCSKTYKVISPSGEEMTITNLKQFCRERNLIDINMVRTFGSKGWHAHKIYT